MNIWSHDRKQQMTHEMRAPNNGQQQQQEQQQQQQRHDPLEEAAEDPNKLVSCLAPNGVTYNWDGMGLDGSQGGPNNGQEQQQQRDDPLVEAAKAPK